jgi:hypothetical protein
LSSADASRRAATKGERASARLLELVVLTLVGIPALALTVENIGLAYSGGGSWGMAAAILTSGLPIVPVAVRRLPEELLLIVAVFWFACFASCVAAASGTPHGLGLAGALNAEVTPVLRALAAAATTTLCIGAIAYLRASEGRTPAQAAPEAAPAPVVEAGQIDETSPEAAFQTWFESCVSFANGESCAAKDAYKSHEAWASLNHIANVLPYTTFGRLMTENIAAIGGSKGTSNGTVYRNIKVTRWAAIEGGRA